MAGKVSVLKLTPEQLVENANRLFDNEQYDQALTYLSLIEDVGIFDYELTTLRVTCYLYSSRYRDGLDYYKSIYGRDDTLSLHFLILLFQGLFRKERYDLIVEYYEELDEANCIHNEVRRPLFHFYHEGELLLEDESTSEYFPFEGEFLERFEELLDQEDLVEQYNLIMKLESYNVHPTDEMKEYLIRKGVHPMIKTKIMCWFKRLNKDTHLTVSKFGKIKSGSVLDMIDENKQIKAHIIDDHFELKKHSDPTYYTMLDKIYESYSTLVFPFDPTVEEVPQFVEALTYIVNESFGQATPGFINDDVKQIIHNINTAHSLYYTIHGEEP